MKLYPHLSWFISVNGIPYLYRTDSQRRDRPRDNHVAYGTCAEACKAASIDLENFIRSL